VRAVVVTGLLGWLVSVLVLDAPPAGAGPADPYTGVLVLSVLQTLFFLGGGVVLGESSRLSAQRLAELQLRTGQLVAERERASGQAAAHAVSVERFRIARELHDVVAHHVSAMGVQAAAARKVLGTSPAVAGDALRSIEVSARSAVEETHRILVTLRSDDEAAPAASDAVSVLGVDQLPALVAQVERTGTLVRMVLNGVPRPVPATVGLTAYRLAQEALTNVRKHAGPGARADLRLTYLPTGLGIEVVNHGGDRQPHPPDRTGLGQLGMRERVSAVGGRFEAGPVAGGYRVEAVLPLPDVAAAAVPPTYGAAAAGSLGT